MDYVSIELSFFAQNRVLALRIHISEITKSILEKDPGFRLELRGQVEMKGKVSIESRNCSKYQNYLRASKRPIG